ncbi:hypothetical protein MTO96_009024 [Rhipicephalus appendiculatus]
MGMSQSIDQHASRATSSRPPLVAFVRGPHRSRSSPREKIRPSPRRKQFPCIEGRDEAGPYRPSHLDKGPRAVRELRLCGSPPISVASTIEATLPAPSQGDLNRRTGTFVVGRPHRHVR